MSLRVFRSTLKKIAKAEEVVDTMMDKAHAAIGANAPEAKALVGKATAASRYLRSLMVQRRRARRQVLSRTSVGRAILATSPVLSA